MNLVFLASYTQEDIYIDCILKNLYILTPTILITRRQVINLTTFLINLLIFLDGGYIILKLNSKNKAYDMKLLLTVCNSLGLKSRRLLTPRTKVSKFLVEINGSPAPFSLVNKSLS